MRMLTIAASLAALVPAQDPTSQSATKAAYEKFRAEAGGDWIVQWHAATDTPSAIYGTGLPIAGWRNSLERARVEANQLLTQRSEMLGLGTSEFREGIGARMGRSWSFTFDQFFRGVPVIDGRADVRVNMSGVVAMFGSRAWPIPANFDITPGIAEEVAIAAAWQALDVLPTGVPQPAPVGRPRLVIWGDTNATEAAPVFLCWEVAISNVDAQGNGPIGRYRIDAKTGAVRHWQNDKHECGLIGCTYSTHAARTAASAPPIPTTVTLMSWTRTGNDALSALVNVPLPGVVLSVPGVGNVTTDLNGEFTIDIAAPVNITVGTLDGRHHNPISGANAPSALVTVNPGVPTTIQLLTAAATTNEAAHPTTSYWVDRTNEFCRSILGNSSQLATASNIGVTVNIASTCNAYYTGNTINFYSAGGGCSNTAFSTVVAHEWGHGIDDRYGGIFNSNAEGLSEGWGDIIGLYLVDSPVLGSGFQTAGVGIRDGNNSNDYPYSTGSPHGAGQVWMGFAWKLRERLRLAYGTPTAIAISNDIVISSIVANATTRVDAVREVFIADDNDGNLLNGTPNYAQLEWAALDKAIPYPAIVLGTITHTALASTNLRLTPRRVDATVVPNSGSYTQVRLHFNAGSGNVVRNMHPNGAVNGYTAMLPGVPVGNVSYHIEAVHSTGPTTRFPASGEIAYSVDGATSSFFLQNFDSGSAGWSSTQVLAQNDWQVADPAGKSGTSGGVAWADPQNAASAPNCYGNDLGNTIAGQTWNGSYMPNVENYLLSPIIDCTGKFGVKLRFKRWLTVQGSASDQATISVNGAQVWINPTTNLVDTAWTSVEYALPTADNNPVVQLQWRLKSNGSTNLGGWNIDDVELVESLPIVAGCDYTMLPEQAAQGASMTLTILTPSSARPFVLAIGDAPGPTTVPDVPTMQVGGAIALLHGATDAGGSFVVGFNAPMVPSAIGSFFYTQVLTLDAALTNFVLSNAHVNMFTQTP
jgi:hypothetical protein